MIRFAVLGCGKICHRFIKGLQLCSSGKLVGFGARDIDRAKQYAEQYQVDLYGDYETILSSPQVDAVYISTFNPGHYDLVKMALEHHKHVLCEKPMVPTVQQYESLFEIAKENGCLLMEAFKGMFLPLNQQIKELMNSGKLGDIGYIHASYCSRANWPTNHWIFDPISGGCLQDVGSYPASVVSFLLDFPEMDYINKHITNYNGVSGFAQVVCRKDDIQIQLNSSNRISTENYLEICGRDGMIRAKNFWKGNHYSLTLYQQNITEEIDVEMKSDFYYETQHFIECIENGLLESPIASKEVTLKLLKLTDNNDY